MYFLGSQENIAILKDKLIYYNHIVIFTFKERKKLSASIIYFLLGQLVLYCLKKGVAFRAVPLFERQAISFHIELFRVKLLNPENLLDYQLLGAL